MDQNVGTNKKHKDRLFRDIFGNPELKENLLSLYNALNNTNYTNPDDLILNTIDDVIYMGMKNDVSCIIEQNMSLYEHQSTYNPNMPLRGFMYFGKLYSNYITTNEYSLYSKQLIKIPVPQYYVFYNGLEEIPDRKVLHLSDAFNGDVKDGEFEWTAIMLNINKGHNKELMSKCRVLWEYAEFVARVREYHKKEKDFRTAINDAVDSCIRDGILREYLMSHKSEVIEMCITEYDEAETFKILSKEVREESYAEGRADGFAEGRAEGELLNQQKTIRRMKKEKLSTHMIAKIMEVTEEYIDSIV